MPLAAFGSNAQDFGRGGITQALAAVPFQRRLDPTTVSTYLTLEQHELQRLRRYSEAWNFYYGRQWSFSRPDGDPLVTLNYARKLIDKSVNFLVSKGITTNVHTALEQVTKPFLDKVWKDNAASNLLYEIGITGAVTGDAFILFTYEAPTQLQLRINPYTQGKVRINLLGSEQVFPTWDPLDITRMIEVRIETIVANPDLRTIASGAPGSEVPGHFRYTQIITADTITRKDWKSSPVISPNLLGEIPIVHIKNLSLPNEYYGLPDTQDLIDLQRELNEKATDISDVVNYSASPTLVITGAKAKQLDKGPKKIWTGLPADAKAFYLEYNGDMKLSHAYFDRVKKALHEISDVPENSLGGSMAVSNTSGVALQMLYRPLIEKTDKKKATYLPGLEKGNYFILRLGQIANLLKLKFDLCSGCGGRIIEKEVTIPGSDDGTGKPLTRLQKACYAIDKRTLEFIDPMEMRVKYKRNYLEGSEYREGDFWKVLALSRGVDSSFWQPDVTDEAENGADHPLAPLPPEVAAIPVAPKRNAEIGKFGPGDAVDLPEEPEEVTIINREYNVETGQPAAPSKIKRFLVPMDCTINEYLNPFDSEVTFGDPLPRDQKLEADLYQSYLAMGIVSKKWVQRQIAVVAQDMTQINLEIGEEASDAFVPPPGPIIQPELKAPEDIQAEQENGPANQAEEAGDEPPSQADE